MCHKSLNTQLEVLQRNYEMRHISRTREATHLAAVKLNVTLPLWLYLCLLTAPPPPVLCKGDNKTYMGDWLFFQTLDHFRLWQSYNHLYLWWHESEEANNLVKAVDEWSQCMLRWPVLIQMLAKYTDWSPCRQAVAVVLKTPWPTSYMICWSKQTKVCILVWKGLPVCVLCVDPSILLRLDQ